MKENKQSGSVNIFTLILGALVGALGILPFVQLPENFSQYLEYTSYATLGLGFFVIIASFLGGSKPVEGVEVLEEEVKDEDIEAVVKPDLSVKAEESDARDAMILLRLLQEKGRFIDFVMDDVSSYTDAQVGAASRVVHQGCSQVIKEIFTIQPIENSAEQQSITIEPGYVADKYKLVGQVVGEAPYKGTLQHKGWVIENSNMPKAISDDSEGLKVLAPAQVEIK